MEELGIKGFPDIAEIEAKQAEDTYNLTQQQNLLTIAIIMLKAKMDFPVEDELNVIGENYTTMILRVTETPYSIYKQSKEYNPKAQVAEHIYNIQKLNYKASKGNMLPSISMNGGVSTNFFRNMDGRNMHHLKISLKKKRGQYVGFSLHIPIFYGFSRTTSVKSRANS